MVRASLLSSLGLWSGSSPQPCNSAALATAELCKSSVTLAKILKQSKSSPSAPDQNITCSGLSQECQNMKPEPLHCMQSTSRSPSYMSSDMFSEDRLTGKEKKIYNSCKKPKIFAHPPKLQAATFIVAPHLLSFNNDRTFFIYDWSWWCATPMNAIQLKH